jgi:hypothetical protein
MLSRPSEVVVRLARQGSNRAVWHATSSARFGQGVGGSGLVEPCRLPAFTRPFLAAGVVRSFFCGGTIFEYDEVKLAYYATWGSPAFWREPASHSPARPFFGQTADV